MNRIFSFGLKHKGKIFIAIAVILILFVAFHSFNNIEKRFEKIHCEATPCTDSLCLHWNDSLQRCGTADALFNEAQRTKNERLFQANDSLHTLLLATIAKEDSLIAQYISHTNKLEEQIKTVDIYSHRLKKIEVLDSLFLKLRTEEYLNLEKIHNERIRQLKLSKPIFQHF